MVLTRVRAAALAGGRGRSLRWFIGEFGRWQALGKDAGGDTALVGTVFRIEQELGWRADWRLVRQGDHRWQIRGITFDAAFRNAMEGSAQIISGHGEPK